MAEFNPKVIEALNKAIPYFHEHGIFCLYDIEAIKSYDEVCRELHGFLLEKGFRELRPIGRAGDSVLTDKGRRLYHAGSYDSFLRMEKSQNEKDAKNEMIANTKLEYDLKNAQRVYKTYWWTFGFSITALLISLVLLFLKLMENSK